MSNSRRWRELMQWLDRRDSRTVDYHSLMRKIDEIKKRVGTLSKPVQEEEDSVSKLDRILEAIANYYYYKRQPPDGTSAMNKDEGARAIKELYKSTEPTREKMTEAELSDIAKAPFEDADMPKSTEPKEEEFVSKLKEAIKSKPTNPNMCAVCGGKSDMPLGNICSKCYTNYLRTTEPKEGRCVKCGNIVQKEGCIACRGVQYTTKQVERPRIQLYVDGILSYEQYGNELKERG